MKYECSRCGYCSENITAVSNHTIKKKICNSIKNDNPPTVVEVEFSIECKYCHKNFHNTSNLNRHLKNDACRVKIETLEKQLQKAQEEIQLQKAQEEIQNLKIKKLEEENRQLKLAQKPITVNKNVYLDKNAIRTEARKLYCKNYDLKCVQCGNDNQNNIQICHIKALKDFTTNCLIGDINKLSNLISLCANCHLDLDKGKIFKVQRTATLHSFIVDHLSSIADYDIL